MAGITLQGVARRYGEQTVLDGLDLTIGDGEFVSLLGPSGCGKSTLLRLIAGLDLPDAGRILLDDVDITATAPKRRDVAMVFQSYALYPYMTVAQNIALPLEMRRLSAPQRLPLIGRIWPGAARVRAGIGDEVRRAAAATSIDHLLARKPAQLSGGQRQRVALARALVRRPKAFLLDEPLSNLDAGLRHQMRDELAALHRRLGATFVYVTHDQDEALAMSDRVAVMSQGRILQCDSPRNLYERPATLEVARFIGNPRINLLPATADGRGALAVEDVPLPLDQAALSRCGCTIGFRPDAVRLDPLPAAVTLAVTLDQVVYRGQAQELHLTTRGGNALIATVPPDRRLPPSGPLTIAVPLQALMIFGADGRRLEARGPELPRLRSVP